MTGPLRGPARFRESLGGRPRASLSRLQTVALLSVLALAIAAVTVASILVKPSKSRTFALIGGSVFLQDNYSPVAVNLATGKSTVKLTDANAKVTAPNLACLGVVPLDNGTLLINMVTGEFNIVDNNGFVIKTDGGGVTLGGRPQDPTCSTAASQAFAVASGGSAYIVQSDASQSGAFLVGQNTVQSASAPDAKAKARASLNFDEPVTEANQPFVGDGFDSSAASAVAANDSLWLLTGSGNERSVHELSVPKGSDTGVALSDTDHGTVTTPAALASGEVQASGTDIVALASSDQLRVFLPTTSIAFSLDGLTDVDRIMPVSNAQGSVDFLYHSSAGWSLVSVSTDGRTLTGPTLIRQLPADAALISPAWSSGHLYTMNTASVARDTKDPAGTLWEITGPQATQIKGAYPLNPSEPPSSYRDSTVFARDGRVIFNSPAHRDALVIFSDDTRPPSVVDKSEAVSLNANGGAVASPSDTPTAQASKTPQPITPPAVQINNEERCKNTTNPPNVPTAVAASQSSSRSVTLIWSYPLIDPSDCEPTSYVLGFTLLPNANAPAPVASIPVTAQVTPGGLVTETVTNLYPNTTYVVTVTAVLNGRGTSSAPTQVTTAREGPAAPTNVHTVSNGNGNWTVSWQACGSVQRGCVQAASWNVVATVCDGGTLVSVPSIPSVIGDPTLNQFSTVVVGSSAVLGRGLSFQVQGVDAQQDNGTFGSDGTCTASWKPPAVGAMTLNASTPNAAFQGTSTATVSLDLGSDQIGDVGGVGAMCSFTLLNSDGTLQSSSPNVDCLSSGEILTQTFSGLQPGHTYRVRANVAPPKHAEATAIVGPTDIAVRADWPALGLTASFASADPASGTLNVAISGISSAQASGETFNLVNGSLTCGSTSLPLTANAIDPAVPLQYTIDRTQIYGDSCRVSAQLVESSAGIFAGQPSGALADHVSIPAPSFGEQQSDFAAQWSIETTDPTISDITVSYGGADGALFALTSGMTVTLQDTNGDVCSADSPVTDTGLTGTTEPFATFHAVTQTCIDSFHADSTTLTVSVAYSFFGSQETFTGIPVTGIPAT